MRKVSLLCTERDQRKKQKEQPNEEQAANDQTVLERCCGCSGLTCALARSSREKCCQYCSQPYSMVAQAQTIVVKSCIAFCRLMNYGD